MWDDILEINITLIGLGVVLLAALGLWLYVKVKRYCKNRK